MPRSSARNLHDGICIDRSTVTFNQVHGDWNQIAGDLYIDDGEQGLLALSRAASVAALHDASERFPPPKCHPEARKEVRSILMSWIEDFYISPDAYHTQFAKICLTHCDPAMSNITEGWRTLAAHTEWKFHLLRAQGTPRILAKLLDIQPGPWLAEGLPAGDTQAKIRSIKDILGWLEKLSPTPTAIVQKWQMEMKVIEKMEDGDL